MLLEPWLCSIDPRLDTRSRNDTRILEAGHPITIYISYPHCDDKHDQRGTQVMPYLYTDGSCISRKHCE
jgi:hypothetical protein